MDHELTGHFDSRLVLAGLARHGDRVQLRQAILKDVKWGARTAIKSLHAEDGLMIAIRSRLWTAANAQRCSEFHFNLYADAQVPQ